MPIKNKAFFGLIVVAAILIALTYIFFNGKSLVFAQTCQEHNLSGYAWSSNIGWLSFSCKNQNADVDYGVDVDSAGLLSGYAWSENIGWVSFNETDLTGCPQGTCEAKLDSATKKLSGWARAYRAVNPEGQTLGGWDGWLKLSGVAQDRVIYGVSAGAPAGGTCDWSGYAWGGDGSLAEAVVGWVSFGGATYGVKGEGNACGVGIEPPKPKLSVSKTGCEGKVVSSPIGIDCGTIKCGKEYAPETPPIAVTLTATPIDSVACRFKDWSGDCSGTGNCSITMTSDKNVTANFESKPDVTGDIDCNINANPSFILIPGLSSKLEWDCSYPDDGDVNNLQCSIGQGIGNVSYNSSLTVTPTNTTTYTLTCNDTLPNPPDSDGDTVSAIITVFGQTLIER